MALGTRDTAGSPTRRAKGRAALRALAVPVLLAPLLALAGPGAGAAEDDPEPTWMPRASALSPTARYIHAMAFDAARGEVVLFGGSILVDRLGDTWVWDGTTWTEKTPATSPPARSSHAMAFDAARGEVVLFGGYDGSRLGDTWVWDGTTWTEKTPATSPPARSSHAMAFDAARGEVVLFGGDDGSRLGDTWVWDGTTWTEKTPATSPLARNYPAVAYDAARGEVVLFGGSSSGSQYFGNAEYLGDTWVWDGTTWTERFPVASPTARYSHAMAHDAARGEVVLFGGSTARAGVSSSNLGDTWVWDGTTWTERFPVASPPVREHHAVAYDTSQGEVVLFGGFGASEVQFYGGYGSTLLGDTWVWDSTEYASDACDGVAGSSTVADGFVGDAYLKVHTAPGDDPSETLVCFATEAGGLHLGGAIIASGGATPSVDTDFAACDANVEEADLHHERVPAVLGQELFHLDVNLMGDEVWVCLRLAADSSTDRRVVVPVDPGSPPDLDPALDPLTPRVPAYTAAPPADPSLPSSACQGAAEGTTTRVVNAEVSGTHAWLYAWQEPGGERAHLCVRGEGADDAGGRLTVDGNGSQTVVTTSTDVAPCDFNIVTDQGGPGPVPGYTIKTSDPEGGAPASVCVTTTTGVAQRVTVDAGDQSVVTWTPDA